MTKKFALKNYQHPDKFGELLGYRIDKMNNANGSAEVSIQLTEKHLSPSGKIHGGVISGFFDFACGAAVFATMDPHDFCSTVEIKVNYFRPLFTGDSLKCKSQVVYRGNRLRVVSAFLYRKKEKKPVAMASATFNIVSKKNQR